MTLEAFVDAQPSGHDLAKALREFVDCTVLPTWMDFEIRRMLLDHQAFSTLQSAVEWEDRGKWAKGFRDREAIAAYCRALDIEPDNAEASMDLAQALGTIGRTCLELTQYARNDGHRSAPSRRRHRRRSRYA